MVSHTEGQWKCCIFATERLHESIQLNFHNFAELNKRTEAERYKMILWKCVYQADVLETVSVTTLIFKSHYRGLCTKV